jgi:hypothetical protein
MKKSYKVLHYFSFGMLEFLQIFFAQAVIQRTIDDFPAFLETGLVEKISDCVHTTRVPNKNEEIEAFLYEVTQNFEVVSNIQN